MSLSRILNDDPVPPPSSSQPAHSSLPSLDPALMDRPPSSHSPPPAMRTRRRSQSGRLADYPAPSRNHMYQPTSLQPSSGWDPRSGEWVQAPHGPEGNFYPSHSPPKDVQGSQPNMLTFVKDGIPGMSQSPPKKRRKTADDDADYQPPGSRRVCSPLYFPRISASLTPFFCSPDSVDSLRGTDSFERSLR